MGVRTTASLPQYLPSVDNLFNINRHLLRVDACFDPSIVINLHDFRDNTKNNTNSKCVL